MDVGHHHHSRERVLFARHLLFLPRFAWWPRRASRTKVRNPRRGSFRNVTHKYFTHTKFTFESRLCGRFFSRPIFLVIYGFIKSLYVSAFTYSHPVGMCVFSRFKNLSMLAMPRKSVSLKIGEGMGCYLVPLLSFAFARASVPFSRSFLVSFLLVLPRHTSLHRVSE